jgi:hypothetical protein
MKNKESIKITLESFDHVVLNKAMGEMTITSEGMVRPVTVRKTQQVCPLADMISICRSDRASQTTPVSRLKPVRKAPSDVRKTYLSNRDID